MLRKIVTQYVVGVNNYNTVSWYFIRAILLMLLWIRQDHRDGSV